jgi:predicted amidophosphoribosyltransferase
MRAACSSCGAALTPGSERCDLCGTAVAGAPEDTVEGARVESPSILESAPIPTTDPAPGTNTGSTASGPSFCIACGHANVPEARFCNRCGAELPSRVEGAPALTASLASAGEDVEHPIMPPEREDAHDRPSSEPG